MTTIAMRRLSTLIYTLTFFLLLCMTYENVSSMDMRTMNKCKPHHHELCAQLYNETHLDRSLNEAILDLNQYTDLVGSKCSPQSMRGGEGRL